MSGRFLFREESRMKSRNSALFIALSMLAALFFFPLRLTAHQAAPSAAKQMVPNNPAEHPAPEQPIPYTHKKHLAFCLQCKTYHTNPQPDTLTTLPATTQ